ncbi:polymorphic toxin-type HINT domain-containing protein [Paenibacillus ehimensis]|uniref:polymorphic toxin-type HINT domain-containing protein n=1 Tax=Paenibacillus ehimensis TaxID=79264 RepID=UPI002DBA9AD3|nr:polymorphic toxin-type HINT domain-containing protein [Paenibacillus ehimensis]MEC0210419.1 polymorphic toxin-type HINT domain-containing protein [Paenibacillus ehimensis]
MVSIGRIVCALFLLAASFLYWEKEAYAEPVSYVLSPGSSVVITAYPDSRSILASVKVSGGHDFVRYYDNGAVNDYKRSDKGTSYSISGTNRIVLTNTSSSSITLSSNSIPYQIVSSSTPALKKVWLSPGSSLDVTNTTGKSSSITTGGISDYVKYDDAGEVVTFTKGKAAGELTLSAKHRIALTNRDKKAYEVWGPYEMIEFSTRTSPAIYYKTLSPGQSLEAANVSPRTLSLAVGGLSDNAIYDADGSVNSYARKKLSGTVQLSSGKRMVVTNTDSKAYEVSGPYDGFTFADRAKPASFTRTLSPGQSVKATNTSPKSFNVSLSGTYDYAEHRGTGQVVAYGRNQRQSSNAIGAANYLNLTNTGASSVEIAGPYDAFTVADLSHPALSGRTLSPGQSLEVSNPTAYTANVTLGGTYDYAVFDSSGITSYARAQKTGNKAVDSSERLAVTNTGGESFQVFGPYETFSFADRTQPVTFKAVLAPGQSVDALNQTAKAFYLTLNGEYDYARYSGKDSLQSYARKSTAASMYNQASERIAITNAGGGSMEISGSSDAYRITSRALPTLVIRTLSQGQSMEATNVSSGSVDITTLGTYDYAYYTDSDDLTTSGRKRNTGTFTVSPSRKVALTNSGMSALEVSAPYDVLQTADRVNPALFVKNLAPMQSMEAVNVTAKDYYVRMTGKYDYATYSSSTGPMVSYSDDNSIGSVLTAHGKKIAVMNTDTVAIDVWGPYDAFTVADRSAPVTFVQALSPGQTLKAVNLAGTAYSVKLTGMHDYANYNGKGEAGAYGRKKPAGNRSVGSSDQLIVTNADAGPIQARGPYDAFQLANRTEPALFIKSLAAGQSMEAVHTGSKASTVTTDGLSDYGIYDAAGALKSYSDDSGSGPKQVDPGEHIAIMNTEGPALEVIGPYDIFRVSDRAKPVSFVKQLAPGQSVHALNEAGTSFSIRMSGVFDYASYKGKNSPEYYGRAVPKGSKGIGSGDRLVVTNADTQSITVKGSYDAFQISDRTDPALFVKALARGQSMEAALTGAGYTTVSIKGTHDYAMYEGSGPIKSYVQDSNDTSKQVNPGERIAIMNAELDVLEVFGPYDMFRITERATPVSFVKMLAPGQTVAAKNDTASHFSLKVNGKHDYATYKSSGNVEYDGRSALATGHGVSAGGQVVLTNVDAQSIRVKGSYDAFRVTDRTDPAFYVRTLDSGQSAGLMNVTGATIYIDVLGVSDYTIYNSDGSVSSFVKGATPRRVSLSPFKRIVIAYADTAPFQIAVPFDAVTVDDGSGPVAFMKELAPGQSMEAVNISSREFSVKASGVIDVVKYNGSGDISFYDREGTFGSIPLGASHRIAITNRDNQTIVVTGSKDAFRITDRANPALLVKTLASGQSLEAQAATAAGTSLRTSGKFDYAVMNENGSIQPYQKAFEGYTLTVAAGKRAAITNAEGANLTVWGPYDTLQMTDRSQPALVSASVAPAQSMQAANRTGNPQSITVRGTYTYVKEDGTQHPGVSPLTIPAGVRYGILNTGTAELAVFGPADAFEFETADKPISGVGAVEEIRKLDPSQYDTQSLHADPVDTATGAQIIQRTLLTAHGAADVPFTVQYYSLLLNSGVMGPGWGHLYDIRLEDAGDGKLSLHWNANRKNTFTAKGSGLYGSDEAAVKLDRLIRRADGSYTLTRKDGTVYEFSSAGRLLSLGNKQGQALSLSYHASGQLASVTEPLSGIGIGLSYDANGRLTVVQDPLQRQVKLSYNAKGQLEKITDAAGQETVYSYDDKGRILTATEQGIRTFSNTFDSQGRIIAQQDAVAGHRATKFEYVEKDGTLVTAVTDREGSVNVLTHDKNYRLLRVRDALGQETSYTYDSEGNRTQVTDAEGKTDTFAYDGRGNLLSVTDSSGQKVTMTYDDDSNLLTVTNPQNEQIVSHYDAKSRLIGVTDPEGHLTTYAYDANGFMTQATDALSRQTTYGYTNGLLASVTNQEGNTVTYSYDAAGRVIGIKGNDGKETLLTYNANDQVLSVTDPAGQTVSYTYDAMGNPLTETDAKGNVTQYFYDGNGNLTGVKNALNQETRFEYDGEGRLVKETNALGHSTLYAYDAKGRLVRVTNALGESIRYEYDVKDRLTAVYDALNRKIRSVEFDSQGNPVTITDALNRKVTQQFDALNRLTQWTDPKGRQTQLAYDKLSRLVEVTDAKQGKAAQIFDAVSQVTGVTDPNRNETKYVYDKAGRLLSETNAAGHAHTYAYDANGRLEQETNGRGQATAYRYDQAGRLDRFTDPEGSVTYTYDANGNITAVTDQSGKTATREYDKLDRVIKYTDTDGNVLQYGYNEIGQLTTLTYPDGKKVTYTYDTAGRMTEVTDWAGRKTAYAYDANGRLLTTTRPDGSVETRDYDAAGQLMKLWDRAADGSYISQYQFGYDEAGNVIQELNEAANPRVQGVTAAVYGRSAAGTVTSATYASMTSLPGPVSGNIAMTYTADNRLATFNGSPVTYDQDGNMIWGPLGGTMQEYRYDARNRLIAAGGVSYAYNAENQRIAVTSGGQTTRYVVNPNAWLPQVLMEKDDQGKAKAYYVYGLGLIGREEASGEYRTYHYDRRGSTIALTDAKGQVTDRYTYGPYGETLKHEGNTDNPFQYNGRDGVMTDPNGLYYMRARYYQPEIKRFVNRDVLTGTISEASTLNRYAYVNGNPVSYVDPFGLSRDGDSSFLLQGGNFLVDTVPWVGTIKGFQQAFLGTNFVTGERLSTGDRWAEGIGSALSLIPIPGLKHAGKYATKGVIAAEKQLERLFMGPWMKKAENTVKKLINECNCFTAGTKVLTDEGEENIEDIEVGDKVLSKDEKTGEAKYKEVIGLYRNDRDDIIKLHVGNQPIETTNNHPFWVEGKGWVLAGSLQVGDRLQQSNGNSLTIDKIELVSLTEKVQVYNLTVADYSTYYVTNLGIWVHNTDCLKGWIKHDLYNEVRGKFAKKGADRFIAAMNKGVVRGTGENGVKYVGSSHNGKGVLFGKTYYQYEVKLVGGSEGDWRLLGNWDEKSGQVIYTVMANHKQIKY